MLSFEVSGQKLLSFDVVCSTVLVKVFVIMSVNELSFNIVADKLIEQWHGLRSDSISTVNLSFNNVLP